MREGYRVMTCDAMRGVVNKLSVIGFTVRRVGLTHGELVKEYLFYFFGG